MSYSVSVSAFMAPTVGALGEACLAANGRSLCNRHNAVNGRGHAHPKGAVLMARPGVAALVNGTTITCVLRLVAKHQDSAEYDIITLKGH